MKTAKIFLLPVLLIALATTLFSCEEDDNIKVTISSTVTGQAVATPSTVKNGDEVQFTIGGRIAGSEWNTINGEEYYPVVHYLIDGVEVADSEEKGLPFSATYTVEDLAIGEHTLSVSITPSHSGEDSYTNNVTPSTITVIE